MQAVESRIALAGALAQQWFGVLTRPRTPKDAWLVHGLAGYLRDVWVRKALGRNEVRYRSATDRPCRLASLRMYYQRA